MTKNPKIMLMGRQLKDLKPGGSFVVATSYDRNEVLKAANVLYAAGAINFEIETRRVINGQGFDVIRLINKTKQGKGKE